MEKQIITLQNINELQEKYSIVLKRRVVGFNNKIKYRLEEDLVFQLSNKEIITIPKGFVWDGSSVPRFLWSLFPSEGDFEVGALIHDYLYVQRKNKSLKFNNRKFADKEMLIWSNRCSGTTKISMRNFDNQMRYIVVRLFGWTVWKDIFKIK